MKSYCAVPRWKFCRPIPEREPGFSHKPWRTADGALMETVLRILKSKEERETIRLREQWEKGVPRNNVGGAVTWIREVIGSDPRRREVKGIIISLKAT